MNMNITEWKRPYEVKEIRLTGWFLTFSKYNVCFQDDSIFTNLNKQTAERLAAALNGAYNLGALSESIEK